MPAVRVDTPPRRKSIVVPPDTRHGSCRAASSLGAMRLSSELNRGPSAIWDGVREWGISPHRANRNGVKCRAAIGAAPVLAPTRSFHSLRSRCPAGGAARLVDASSSDGRYRRAARQWNGACTRFHGLCHTSVLAGSCRSRSPLEGTSLAPAPAWNFLGGEVRSVRLLTRIRCFRNRGIQSSQLSSRRRVNRATSFRLIHSEQVETRV
jgi:hypothetical protein